jgi:hypothetical protein
MTDARPRATRVGIVVPVHDEEDLLPRALQALDQAVAHVPLGVRCRTALVLDACIDASSTLARRWANSRDALVLVRGYTNVGAARRVGCDALLASWAGEEPEAIWLASTDADSEVPGPWLLAQLAAYQDGADLWAGRVEVVDWSVHDPETARRWHAAYGAEAGPVHGTSMGLSAVLYERLGGFRALRTGEDRDLYARAVAQGARVRHETNVKVTTSARRKARAPLGFAHALISLDTEFQDDLTVSA